MHCELEKAIQTVIDLNKKDSPVLGIAIEALEKEYLKWKRQ
jgi:hypothetical protein